MNENRKPIKVKCVRKIYFIILFARSNDVKKKYNNLIKFHKMKENFFFFSSKIIQLLPKNISGQTLKHFYLVVILE